MHLMLCSDNYDLKLVCPPGFFIVKLQMYYNKAYCNIYNPVLITMSVYFFLDWNVLKLNVTLKHKFSIYLSIRLLPDIAYFWCF